MGVVHERIAAALAAEVEGRGGAWDELPGLFLVCLGGGVPELAELPVPGQVWASDRPPQVLEMLARGMRAGSGVLQASATAGAPGLHGVAFRAESWLVRGEGLDAAGRARLEADTAAHRLHARPDRVEVRCMWAVDRAGITYMAMLERGEPAAVTEVLYPRPGGPAVSGTIPAALDAMVTALLGVALPARQPANAPRPQPGEC